MTSRPARILLLSLVAALPAAADDHPKTPEHFAGLKYRSIGPGAGGRTTRAVGVAGDPRTYYVAAAGGGVWKSEDGGFRFKPVFDDQPAGSVGSLAVAPSDPNVVYVGAGEANIRGNVQPGNGIYRSTDAGKTWKHVWRQHGQIGTIVVHPKDPDTAYAAVLGHAFGPNPERGVYRTRDGGKTWDRVLFKDPDTGASDVALDPTNPRIVFAGLWQARRRPWDLTSGGKGSGLYVSRDGGDTWEQLGPEHKDPEPNGLPPGPWGRVGVAVAPSDPHRVYAVIEAEKGGLYRSNDGGETWALATDDRHVRQRAWYFSTLTVHPAAADVVYLPQVEMFRSPDGGKTLQKMKGFSHGDHHDFWVDPADPRRMITAHDGGVDLSNDGGKTWRAPPLPISQFYHVACDAAVPYRVMGCMQDMGTARGPSNSLGAGGLLLGDWHTIGGGEAGYAVPDPFDPDVVYAGEYGGYISRYDHRTRQARNVSVYPFDPSGHGAEDLKYRFQWTAPIVASRHEPRTVYHAANVLFRTKNGGQTWEKVSGDLTRNDRNKQKWSGGPITGDNTGAEVYGTIFALAESPVNKKVLWAGTDDGLVHVSKDQSYTWANVTANVPDLPDWGTVTCIEPGPHDEATAYLVVDAHRLDDYRPHVWKTTDFGETWQKLSDDLPADEFARVVREDPKMKGHLYLGTDRQVWHSPDGGAHWHPLRLNMPAAAVTDLVVKDDDLVVATQGRSLWVLDDLTPLREWTKAVENKPTHAFPVPPVYRWSQHDTVTNVAKVGAGQNPPAGAVVTYYLKERAMGPITAEVLNEAGQRIARLVAKEKKPGQEEDEDDDEEETDFEGPRKVEIPGDRGVNRFVWDLRHDGADAIPKARTDSGKPRVGPPVAPGVYTVKLTANGRTVATKVEVRLDPRVTEPRAVAGPRQPPQKVDIAPRVATPEEAARLDKAPWVLRRNNLDVVRDEAKEQERFALRLRDDVTRLTHLVTDLRAVRKQLDLHRELLDKQPRAKALLKQGKELADKLDELEGRLHNPKAKIVYDILAQRGGARVYSQLVSLMHTAVAGDGPPTQGMTDLAEELEKELEGHAEAFHRLAAEDVGRVNELARKLNAPMIWIPARPK